MNTARKSFQDNLTRLAHNPEEEQKNLNTGLLRLSEMVEALDQQLRQVQQQLRNIEGRLP